MERSQPLYIAYEPYLFSVENTIVPDVVPNVNGHIHTPYSFSAFANIEQAFVLAKEADVSVLGINDFYTTEGYGEFADLAKKYFVFPLFNIEFMALQKDLQEMGIRVNDPVNPGRTYFCGKALRYPVLWGSKYEGKIDKLQSESNRQTYQMVGKLNDFLATTGSGIKFDPAAMQEEFAKNLFRERHIVQAVRTRVFEMAQGDEERKGLFRAIFGGKELKSPLSDQAVLENEIRANLLKSGGPAFVEEDPKAFLSLDEIIAIIVNAGGIPCYPVLLDDSSGRFTDFENDREKLFRSLTEKNVWCIELIPGRNDPKILKDFVDWFYKRGFLITFGTEHNTPKLDPLRVCFRDGSELDDVLKQINYEGASVLAAHQYLVAHGEMGFLDGLTPRREKQKELMELGKKVIAKFT